MTRLQPALRGLLALSALALAAACGDRDADGGPEGSEEVRRGGTAVLVESQDMDTPVPLFLATGLAGQLQDMMYMSLLHGEWEDGDVSYQTADESPMALARSYGYVGPDSAALRFHLRSGLRWSDGQPVTAEDVVWTYEALGDPAVGSPRQDYTAQLDSVVAQDDSTVTFFFDHRYPDMRVHVAHAIMPRHVYAEVAPERLSTLTADSSLVVSGPFRLRRWQRGQQIVLERNPSFQPAANLDQVVIRIIPDETTRLVELQTGNVDYVRPVSHDKIPALRQQMPEVAIEREAGRFVDFIAYNPARVEAFSSPEVRRALGLAIDVPGMLRGLRVDEYLVPAAGPYSPIFSDLQDPEVRPLGHDPERARQILEANGWRDTDGDGIRERNGRPFRFTITTNSGNQRRSDVLQIVQRQWREVGVQAEIETVEFASFAQRMFSAKDYEAALFGWQVALSPDIGQLWEPGSPLNLTGYANPQVEALFDSAQAQPTQEAAAPFWRRGAARLVQDQPYTWLYYMDQVSARRPRLRGMRIDTYGPYQRSWEWWVAGPRGTEQAAGAAPS